MEWGWKTRIFDTLVTLYSLITIRFQNEYLRTKHALNRPKSAYNMPPGRVEVCAGRMEPK